TRDPFSVARPPPQEDHRGQTIVGRTVIRLALALACGWWDHLASRLDLSLVLDGAALAEGNIRR
ncbi:MAG: hypothetical protein ACRDQH_10280, partial [Pseudonocardiaceae bacterium]